jgi:uncharacterized protein
LLWGGKPAAIVQAAEQGKVTVFISEQIIEEINQVLAYPKIARIYQTTTVGKNELMQQVLKIGKIVKVTSKVEVIEAHASDNKFLECALDSKADYVVSGDKHLLNVVAFRKIKIVSVSGFLELIP